MNRYLHITGFSLALFLSATSAALADDAAKGAMTHGGMTTGGMTTGEHKPASAMTSGGMTTGGMTTGEHKAAGAMTSGGMTSGAMSAGKDAHAVKKNKKTAKKAATASMSTNAMAAH